MPLDLSSFAEAALGNARLLLECDRLEREGLADRRASLELRLDALPPHVGYAVVGGLHTFHERLGGETVNPEALDEAARLLGLSPATVARLGAARLTIDVDGMPDGTIAFPGEAIATLEGQLADVLIAATVTLPFVRRASSISTAAARLATAADGDALVEAASPEELSRASAVMVARAAYIGGFEATVNPIASVVLEVPLRATASRALDFLGAGPSMRSDPEGWSSLPPETWTQLERGDEELGLLEARRLGARPTGWVITSFCAGEVSLVADLVALEEGGAWRPVAGSTAPGRKMAIRYMDAQGRAVCDALCFSDERLRDAAAFGAASFETLARPILRQGRSVAAPESAREARLRSRAGRLRIPADVLRLRRPAAFRVELSEAVRSAPREPSARPGSRRP